MVDLSIIVATVMRKALSCFIDTRDNVSQKWIITDIWIDCDITVQNTVVSDIYKIFSLLHPLWVHTETVLMEEWKADQTPAEFITCKKKALAAMAKDRANTQHRFIEHFLIEQLKPVVWLI